MLCRFIIGSRAHWARLRALPADSRCVSLCRGCWTGRRAPPPYGERQVQPDCAPSASLSQTRAPRAGLRSKRWLFGSATANAGRERCQRTRDVLPGFPGCRPDLGERPELARGSRGATSRACMHVQYRHGARVFKPVPLPLVRSCHLSKAYRESGGRCYALFGAVPLLRLFSHLYRPRVMAKRASHASDVSKAAVSATQLLGNSTSRRSCCRSG